jgi:hypothetical protein
MAMHKIHYSRILTQRFTRQLLLFLTCAVVFACQAQPLPRLLAIESQNGVGFLLPETHFGLKVEFDAYYSNVILPAAKASNLVVPEGLALGGQCMTRTADRIARVSTPKKRVAKKVRHWSTSFYLTILAGW